MKSTIRYAALLVALVAALNWATVTAPGSAVANEDVEFLQPPTNRGDPDSGGTAQILGISVDAWLRAAGRLLLYRWMPSLCYQAPVFRTAPKGTIGCSRAVAQ